MRRLRTPNDYIRRHHAVFALTACALITLPLVLQPWPKRLLWNASPSVPEGLYYVQDPTSLYLGDLVVTNLPGQARKLAAQRHYLPENVPLLKPIAALPGQTVCRTGSTILIDNIAKAKALVRDSRRRELPVWSGCHTLRQDQIFLMNSAVLDSFDGRYFGPTDQNAITGRAVALYIPHPSVQPLH